MELDGLKGKRVLITAGASGIGAVIARSFVEQGARVHVGDVDPQLLKAFTEANPQVGATVCDVSSSTDVDRLFEEAEKGLGGLDVLVSGAGIAGPVANAEDVDEAGWRRTLDVNLTGAFMVIKRAIPYLKEQRSGSIVVISSTSGLMGERSRTPYVASKWALHGVVKTLAMELGEFGIRANAICPGLVEGDRMDRVIDAVSETMGITPEEARAYGTQLTSLRTFVTPEDVAAMILFICSDAGARISGQALAVDGNLEHT